MAAEKDRTVYKNMDIDGNLIVEHWRLLDKTKKITYDLNKCVGCSLCYVVCPNQAIELGPVPEIAQKLIEDMPAVLIDTDKCSFCFMCERVCINSAYDITDEKGNEIDKSDYPKLKQMWIWDEKTCKFNEDNEICRICKKIRDDESIGRHYAKDLKKVIDECPTKSMKFKSPLEGEVIILKNQLDKCDPNGCKACVNICPTKSFFIPQSAEDILKYGKIACNKDSCMFCGACENACPEKIIVVKRNSIEMNIPDSKDKPWINRWRRQFKNLTLSREQLKNQVEKDKEEVLVKEDEQSKDFGDIKISPRVNFSLKEFQEEVEKNKPMLDKMDANFKRANFRYYIHNKNKEKLRKLIKDSLEEKK
jgi:4Fe-4S ferredoxin